MKEDMHISFSEAKNLSDVAKAFGVKLPEWESLYYKTGEKVFKKKDFSSMAEYRRVKRFAMSYPAPTIQEMKEWLPDTMSRGTVKIPVTWKDSVFINLDDGSEKDRLRAYYTLSLMYVQMAGFESITSRIK